MIGGVGAERRGPDLPSRRPAGHGARGRLDDDPDNAFWEQFVFTDFDRIRFGPDGDLLLFEEEELPSTLRDAFVFTGAKRAFGGGTPTLNARFGNSKFYQETERDGFRGRLPDASPDRRTDIRFDPEFWEGEVGADWERTVATDWSLKLLGLGSLRDQELGSRELIREPVDGPPAITRFD